MTFQHSIVNNIKLGDASVGLGRVLCDTCSEIVAALEKLLGDGPIPASRREDEARKACSMAIKHIKAGNAQKAYLSSAFTWNATANGVFWIEANKHCEKGCDCGF